MAAITKLSQNQWDKLICEYHGKQSWQVWVSVEWKTKMAESKMAKLKMAEFKMATIMKWSAFEWISERKQGVWIQHGRM